ncbi:delta-like protein C, partial [Saccostrea cucullata]|uniref:delta-like protein C n=1 Tax=Saccostrea cuccullata TaxID=36930 RepID=UPI002ED42A0F
MVTLTMECHLIFLVTFIVLCEGSGHISLTMVRYYNPGGRGRNGHPCDGKFFFSGSDCDHRFTICLDQSNGPNNVYRCPYGRKSTGEVSNNNNNYFGGNVGGVANPMIFPFALWPGGIKIKVEVWDVDDNSDDYVDFLAAIYRTIPGFNVTSASLVPYTLSSRTTLWLRLKVYCDQDYYGENCATFCQSRDDRFGHYTCDPNTGSKICLKGWQGTLCHVQIDNCLSSPCVNSATCVNSHGGFLCVCADGFNGTRCEIDLDECRSSPCQNNATCTDLINGFHCTCLNGFSGKT